ncbi:MAG TPA: hypothetical protein ENJ95_13680 [Bacteroidetes bacterium]|nr:hypothetical protein [Bacteroidota bacterium]
MKFLGKTNTSKILAEGLTYQKNKADNNRKLREMLIAEQMNFCAYTEQYFKNLDSVEVEHFNSSKKYNDDYYNYYAALRKPNQYKKDQKYKDKAAAGKSFFGSLFFQKKGAFNSRIEYVDGIYEETDLKDSEAKELIDFLNLNNELLFKDRQNHVSRMKNIFKIAKYDKDNILDYFRKHKEELSFITALEIELDIDLSEFYTKTDT